MIEILNQEIDSEGKAASNFRILVDKKHFKYLTIDPHIYKTNDLCSESILIGKLPPFPVGDWNYGQISQKSTIPFFPSKPFFAETSTKTYPSITPLWHPKSFEYLSLDIGETLGKPNVYMATSTEFSKPVIAKFARFPWEIGYYLAESKVYSWIEGKNIGPEFLGYIMEEGRAIGFLLEQVEGRHAGPSDLPACKAIVGKLHALGIIHSDLNKGNFFIGEKGITLIDFETAKKSEDKEAMEKELMGLEGQLRDVSGEGAVVFEGEDDERIHDLINETQPDDVTVMFPTS